MFWLQIIHFFLLASNMEGAKETIAGEITAQYRRSRDLLGNNVSIVWFPVIAILPLLFFSAGIFSLMYTEPMDSKMWNGEPLAEGEGYWSHMDYFDHAEPNYTISPYIMEFWNTASFFFGNYPLYVILLWNSLHYGYGWHHIVYCVLHLVTVVHGGLVHATGRWELVVPEHLLALLTAASTFYMLAGNIYEGFLALLIFISAKELTVYFIQDELLSNNVGSLILAPIMLYRLACRIPTMKKNRNSNMNKGINPSLTLSRDIKMFISSCTTTSRLFLGVCGGGSQGMHNISNIPTKAEKNCKNNNNSSEDAEFLKKCVLINSCLYFLLQLFDFLKIENYFFNLTYHAFTGHLRVGYTIYTIAMARIYIEWNDAGIETEIFHAFGWIPYVRKKEHVDKGCIPTIGPNIEQLEKMKQPDIIIHQLTLISILFGIVLCAVQFIFCNIYPDEDAFRTATALH